MAHDPEHALAELADYVARRQPQHVLAVVGDDLPCRKCGYNLRTLKSSDFCPECGQSVRYSIPTEPTGVLDHHGSAMALADTDWLGRMRTGALFIVTGACITTVIIVATIVILASSDVEDIRPVAAIFIEVALGLFSIFAGGWILAWPEADGFMREQGERSRIASRFFLALGTVGAALLATIVVFLNRGWFVFIDGFAVASALLIAVGLTGLTIELRYLQHVARRLGAMRTADSAALLQPALHITFGFLFFSTAAGFLAKYLRVHFDWMAGLNVLEFPVLVVFAIFAIGYLVTVGLVARRLGNYLEGRLQ